MPRCVQTLLTIQRLIWGRNRWKAPSLHLSEMPLISFLDDLPTAIGWGPIRHVRMLRDLAMFRRHAPNLRWSSLCDIYPRRVMLSYYLMVFLWGRFCGVHKRVLANPSPAIAGEVFIRYVCAIDAQIDRPDGMAEPRLQPRTLVSARRTRELASELVGWLRRSSQGKTQRDRALRIIREYRRQARAAVLRAAEAPKRGAGLSSVVTEKETVVGGLFRAWSDILGALYDIPAGRRIAARELTHCHGMRIQIVDDLTDIVEDRENAQSNFLLAAAADSGEDVARLLRAARGRWSHLIYGGQTLRRHAPEAHAKILELSEQYMSRIRAADPHRLASPAMSRAIAAVMLQWK